MGCGAKEKKKKRYLGAVSGGKAEKGGVEEMDLSIGDDEIDLKKKKKGCNDVQARKGMKKSSNTVDVDIDPGRMGVGDYGGQMSMRVDPNPKCNGCLHYDQNMGACEIGMVPTVCGDGTYPEIGYAPAQGNRIAAKNWVMRHKDAVTPPSQAADQGFEGGEVKYRVDVLGEGPLALSTNEKLTLMKSADLGYTAQELTQELGFLVSEPFERDLIKGKMTISEFADAVGTTASVVRSIAQAAGDKHAFTNFIKSKLPDIVQAHGLTGSDMSRLYTAVSHTLKSMSPTEWEAWKGVSFDVSVEDEDLARAIQQHGLLDHNLVRSAGIITPAEPVRELPHAEPIQPVENRPMAVDGFVGGNLHLADSFRR